MVPICMISDNSKKARDMARDMVAQIEREADRLCVAVTAEREGTRFVTSMSVSPSLDDDPGGEVGLMKSATIRILSLLVLHEGVRETMAWAIEAVVKAEGLANEAVQNTGGN